MERNGHCLQLESFTSPTWCQYCFKFIYGLTKQGLRCGLCQLTFHQNCSRQDLTHCSASPDAPHSGTIDTGDQHGHCFELHTFLIPTECDACRRLLLGLINQGLQCKKCQANIHEKCKTAFEQICNIPASVPLKSFPSKVRRQVASLCLQTTSGGNAILMEEWLLHFTDRQPDIAQNNFWRLDSEKLSIFSTQPSPNDSQQPPPTSMISLNDVVTVRMASPEEKNNIDFVLQTSDLTYFIIVPALRKHQAELGQTLNSHWESAIRQAQAAYARRQRAESEGCPEVGKEGATLRVVDNLEVLASDYTISSNKILGSGQFGVVYEARQIKTGQIVAVKMVDKHRFRQKTSFQTEIKILSQLHHPGIIQLYHVQQNDDTIYIYMEKLDMDLLNFIESQPGRKLSERQTRFFTVQILTAIRYLHSKNVVHCDLKPENILLPTTPVMQQQPDFQSLQIKLCDFGVSRIIEEASFRSSLVDTPAYLAPEMLTSKPAYNRSLDLWSVGVINYVSLTGYFPFDNPASPDSIAKIIADFWRLFDLDLWHSYSAGCLHFINSLLQFNFDLRPTAEKALKHRWFRCEQSIRDLRQLEMTSGQPLCWTSFY